jgi:hypothetical protein
MRIRDGAFILFLSVLGMLSLPYMQYKFNAARLAPAG